MYLKNNSNKSWLDYNLGGWSIDILPKTVFKVDQKEGELLLRNLGADAWLVQVEEAEFKAFEEANKPKEEKKEEPKKEEVKKHNKKNNKSKK